MYVYVYIHIHRHRHTSMHVGLHESMRSDSESEIVHQLSGILRKANKQTCILVCQCMYMCRRSKNESASHSSPPQLKGVRVISACVHTISLISLLGLSVCQCTPTLEHTHTQAALKTQANTCQVVIENPSFVLKGGNTIAHPHQHKHRGTHSISSKSWKASGCTDVIPFDERSSVPACGGQEPARTSGAPV